MANFTDDLQYVDQSSVELTGPQYPVAQWVNGDPKLAQAGGVAHLGGLALPTKYVDTAVAPPPGWASALLAFSSGKTEAVLTTPKARLAVIRTRFRWFRMNGSEYVYYPRADYAEGMRGHVQALCGVAGFDFPIVVTLKGKASQEFEKLLREFTTKTQEAAQEIVKPKRNGQRFPRFAFYMRLAAGPHVKAGTGNQSSVITPPVLDLPSVISEEYLGKVYVGRERLLAFQQIFHDAAEWADAWGRSGVEVTPDDHDDAPMQSDPGTGELVQRPVAETARVGGSDLWKRWYTLSKQAQGLGLVVPVLDDAANDAEIKIAGKVLAARVSEAEKAGAW